MPGFFPGARENIAVPDDRKGQIVFKWPDMNIRRFTHAIVAPDELAVFMYQGQVKGTLPAGRHQLDATEIPFLGIFADAVTGGNLYRTEIYFVGSREFTQNRFGGKIDSVQDPVSTLIVSLRVFGDYSLKVVEPASLLTNLVGTVDVTDNTAITGWVAEQLLKVLRTDITTQIVRSGWPILGLAAYTPEIEKAVIELANQQLATYGLTVARMGNFTDQPGRRVPEASGAVQQGHRVLPAGRLLPAVRLGGDGPGRRPGHGPGRWWGDHARLPRCRRRPGRPDGPALRSRTGPGHGPGIRGWRGRLCPAGGGGRARRGHCPVPPMPHPQPGRVTLLRQLRHRPPGRGAALHPVRCRAARGGPLLCRMWPGHRRAGRRRARRTPGGAGSRSAAAATPSRLTARRHTGLPSVVTMTLLSPPGASLVESVVPTHHPRRP